MARKLDFAVNAVNAERLKRLPLLVTLCMLAACGPSPRPVAPGVAPAWLTALGNARRAPFESEAFRDSLQVIWDVDAGSGLRASVLISDSAIFLGTTNRQLLAFSTSTGRKFWDQRLEGEIPAEIVRSGRTLFFTTSEWNGRVHARDMERGKKVWRRDVGPARFSPLLDGGIVYAGTDRGHIYALRSEDGEPLWRSHISGSIAATLLSDSNALIAFTATDSVYRVSKQDGAILARAHIESSVSAPPALFAERLIVPTHSGVLLSMNARTLSTLARFDTGAPILAAAIISQQGHVHVINRNGEIWRLVDGHPEKVAAVGGAVTTSFTLARDRYIIGRVDGSMVVTDMNGHIVAEHKFNDSVSAPVAVTGGALYVPLARGRVVKLR